MELEPPEVDDTGVDDVDLPGVHSLRDLESLVRDLAARLDRLEQQLERRIASRRRREKPFEPVEPIFLTESPFW